MAPNVGSNALDATAPAFISYCRQDGEIALRLAGDLKAGGASVWLDQLDIAPGERWDRAVEQALMECRRVLVVLTPASVKSTNVMDEVSFALEKQKTVIPVVHQECDIPFRLGRLQRVDLKLGYEQGLREVLRVLLSSAQTGPSGVAAAVPAVSTLPVERSPAPTPLPMSAPPAAEPLSNAQPSGASLDQGPLTEMFASSAVEDLLPSTRTATEDTEGFRRADLVTTPIERDPVALPSDTAQRIHLRDSVRHSQATASVDSTYQALPVREFECRNSNDQALWFLTVYFVVSVTFIEVAYVVFAVTLGTSF